MESQFEHLINGNFTAIQCETADTKHTHVFMLDCLEKPGRRVKSRDGLNGIYSEEDSRVPLDCSNIGPCG